MSDVKIYRNDIVIGEDCEESLPCQHWVTCKKLNLDKSMDSTEICELFKKYGLNVDSHFDDENDE